MADKRQLEFFLLRYVPDAVKNEFVNIGVVMVEPAANGTAFADVRFTRDWRRVRCLDPGADVEMLEALERDIRGQLRETQDREALLRKLEDSFSNVIQLSPTQACLAEEPAKEIETLASLYFEGPKRVAGREQSGRQQVFRKMRDAFEQAGVWALLRKEIAVAQYTHAGDPLKIDCGYRPNGVVKMFHAVSLAGGVDAAKVLAFSYPQIAEGIQREEGASITLTAVVEDDLDRGDEATGFALLTLEKSRIGVAVGADMPRFAEVAKQELRA
jgi:hypothetical protein